jgi:CBS domain containing-hemolysin-like protein
MRIYDFFDEFDIDIEDDEDFESDNSTLGGWLVTMLEGEPEEDDEFVFENIKLTIKKTDGRRIERISAEIIETEQEEDDED